MRKHRNDNMNRKTDNAEVKAIDIHFEKRLRYKNGCFEAEIIFHKSALTFVYI